MQEQPQTESLNIDDAIKNLTLRALNKTGKNIAAAAAMGISEKTLIRYKRRFNLVAKYCPVQQKYIYSAEKQQR